jgi:hypothetical protein
MLWFTGFVLRVKTNPQPVTRNPQRFTPTIRYHAFLS